MTPKLLNRIMLFHNLNNFPGQPGKFSDLNAIMDSGLFAQNEMKMKKIKVLSILVLTILFMSCEDHLMLHEQDLYEPGNLKAQRYSVLKATGSVEIQWKGAGKGSDAGNKPETLLPFFELNAHMDDGIQGAKGEMVYQVLTEDSLLHRLIKADVLDVYVDPLQDKAWIVGKVIFDSKGCAGNGSDGHATGCGADDGTHDDGGCSHDDGTDAGGGCSDDDGTHDDGGCSHDDGTDVGGGCTHDDGTSVDGTHDEGCSHDDDEHSDEGGCGGSENGGSGGTVLPGSDGKGNPLSGKNCRVGQIIAVKLHDGGTPGTNGDGITWKWFSPDGAFVPSIENMQNWPHLCKKTIVEGNLVIHK